MHHGVVSALIRGCSCIIITQEATPAHLSYLVATYTMWEKSLYPYVICLVYIYVHSVCVWYTIEPESDVWQHCQSHKLAEHR